MSSTNTIIYTLLPETPYGGLLRARAGLARASLLANVKEAFCARRTARLHPRSLFNAAPQGTGTGEASQGVMAPLNVAWSIRLVRRLPR
ncbi:MAG: hypothetical protein RJR37_00660 [Peptococcaceae bacterium MAG4]|nr:hypothetical protein [Peptococcaceae bacterium MAG4]